MKEIGSYEAKTHLPSLLESVLAGESFVITRRGEPIAMLVPTQRAEISPQEAIKQIRVLRKGITWGGEGCSNEAKEEGRR